MHVSGLHKRSPHRWHGLAAILTALPMRRARHRIAAVHRLFWRRHCTAVQRVCREQDCNHRQKNWLSQTHHQITYTPGMFESNWDGKWTYTDSASIVLRELCVSWALCALCVKSFLIPFLSLDFQLLTVNLFLLPAQIGFPPFHPIKSPLYSLHEHKLLEHYEATA